LYHARLSISEVKISSRVQLERSSGQFGIKLYYRQDSEFSLGSVRVASRPRSLDDEKAQPLLI
jgi:hypothetical protein